MPRRSSKFIQKAYLEETETEPEELTFTGCLIDEDPKLSDQDEPIAKIATPKSQSSGEGCFFGGSDPMLFKNFERVDGIEKIDDTSQEAGNVFKDEQDDLIVDLEQKNSHHQIEISGLKQSVTDL